jgi:multimeric flavodoxin WrbA
LGTILAISSSPRRSGNSELLLQSFGLGAKDNGWDINTVRINDLAIRPCQACDQCATTGKCILQDDMQRIYPLVASARAIVIATPVYFGSLSAQLKTLIDRFQCWWHAKYKLDRPWVKPEEGKLGFFLCVGALKKEAYSESALAVARVYFNTINHHHAGSLGYYGIDEKGAIRGHPDALENACEAGRRFAAKLDLVQKSNGD